MVWFPRDGHGMGWSSFHQGMYKVDVRFENQAPDQKHRVLSLAPHSLTVRKCPEKQGHVDDHQKWPVPVWASCRIPTVEPEMVKSLGVAKRCPFFILKISRTCVFAAKVGLQVAAGRAGRKSQVVWKTGRNGWV